MSLTCMKSVVAEASFAMLDARGANLAGTTIYGDLIIGSTEIKSIAIRPITIKGQIAFEIPGRIEIINAINNIRETAIIVGGINGKTKRIDGIPAKGSSIRFNATGIEIADTIATINAGIDPITSIDALIASIRAIRSIGFAIAYKGISIPGEIIIASGIEIRIVDAAIGGSNCGIKADTTTGATSSVALGQPKSEILSCN